MSQSITTSIRLPKELRAQLEQASHTLHQGKNWIIAHALQEYLQKLNYRLLADEARRQSLLASQQTAENELWENNSDITGWI